MLTGLGWRCCSTRSSRASASSARSCSYPRSWRVSPSRCCGSDAQPGRGVVNQFLRALGVQNPPRWLTARLGRARGRADRALGHRRRRHHLPGRAAEHPAPPVRGGRARRRRRLQRFRHITLPMLTPTLFFVLITSLIGAFQVSTSPSCWAAAGAAGGTAPVLSAQPLERGLPQRPLRLRVGAGGGVRRVRGCRRHRRCVRASERWVYYEGDDRGDSGGRACCPAPTRRPTAPGRRVAGVGLRPARQRPGARAARDRMCHRPAARRLDADRGPEAGQRPSFTSRPSGFPRSYFDGENFLRALTYQTAVRAATSSTP